MRVLSQITKNRKVEARKSLIFQQAALARPKGVQPVVSNHRLSAAFSFSRRLSPPKPFEPTSFQLVVVQFLIGGFSPPEGRLARGFKPPAFSWWSFSSRFAQIWR